MLEYQFFFLDEALIVTSLHIVSMRWSYSRYFTYALSLFNSALAWPLINHKNLEGFIFIPKQNMSVHAHEILL